MSGELTRIGEGLFRVVRRGYNREEVDDYVAQLQRRIQELQERSSQEGAVRAALNQVGEDVTAVLQQSHQTATQIVTAARQEADETITSAEAQASETIATAQAQATELTTTAQAQATEMTTTARAQAEHAVKTAQDEAAEHRRQAVEYATEIVNTAERRVQELDLDTDRIWAERERIVADARDLSRQLAGIAEVAAERFPTSEGAASSGAGTARRPTR